MILSECYSLNLDLSECLIFSCSTYKKQINSSYSTTLDYYLLLIFQSDTLLSLLIYQVGLKYCLGNFGFLGSYWIVEILQYFCILTTWLCLSTFREFSSKSGRIHP